MFGGRGCIASNSLCCIYQTRILQTGCRTVKSASQPTFKSLLGSENKVRVQQCIGFVKSPRQDQPGKRKKSAAVLVPLCTVMGVPSLLFTLRSVNLSNYRGQVSFPGGNTDPTDQDVIQTAIRETEEELGIACSCIDVWGTLNPVPGKDFKALITPVLANIGEVDVSKLQYNHDEVSEVFVRSLESLCRTENISFTRFSTGPGYTLPVYTGGVYRVWGLTAIITHMCLTLLAPPPLYTFKLVHR